MVQRQTNADRAVYGVFIWKLAGLRSGLADKGTLFQGKAVPMMKRRIAVVCTVVMAAGCLSMAGTAAEKTFAQRLVETTLAKHSELSGLELSSTAPGSSQCKTVAASNPHDLGEKCDKDELTAMKTGKPVAEQETEKGEKVWDITSPLHDSSGKVVGTVGMEVKGTSGQTKESVQKLTDAIVKEMEQQISSKDALFAPAR